ncbi:uncharacterized protein [Epargyreus clarus]|uniref:uncharacterized protein n=1 Tax=Epargyreus clarus TaxID=520877 RepID=UPI003C2B7112
MFALLLLSHIAASASEQESSAFFNGGLDRNRGLSNMHDTFSNPVMFNGTYIDKADNLLRVPNTYYEEHKAKKKIKKTPKRTIQKIIKKNKFKTRKLYMFPATILPTLASKTEREDSDGYTRYASTSEANYKKKPKKNVKYIRYPMPFQKLHKDMSHRYKREDRDLYILKDLDEIEFLSNEKDHDKILTHVQKYW